MTVSGPLRSGLQVGQSTSTGCSS